ncbi:DUF2214 domain-containing protein [Paracoccus sp. YIM 132242]|uniref:DUF2214 domain-containing protein n=1 Tax=Paracoccus lichenicola TaxID=2665644 RepID=A0A6L6HM39_9RHOB|nr:DUF2214 domain-containing protein [Paracoccus lichenicola]MTE00247.1 DUF2214 domain-containing protein [Paracoccus lichenicola]
MEPLAWIEGLALARALRGSGEFYMVMNAAHILGIGLLVGAILPLDLRVLGVLRGPPLPVIGPFLSRMAGIGLGLAMLTGFCLWSVDAREYLGNAAFRWKLVLLALGLANVALMHGVGWKRVMATGRPGPTARILAAMSAAIWPGVLLAGRWIGFL